MIKPFPYPKKPMDETRAPDQIRGQLNQLAKYVSGDQTLGVTTSAVAIFEKILNTAYATITGDNGSGKIWVDQVVWNGTTNTSAVISSTTVAGAPDARTYTVVAGVLKLAMAAGTYTIVCVPIVYTT